MGGKSNSIVSETSNDQEEKHLAEEIGLRKQQHESLSGCGSIDSHSGKGLDLASALDKSIGANSILYNKTNITQAFEASTITEPIELNAEKVTGPSILSASNQDPSTSILDKLFGSALALNVSGSSSAPEVFAISNGILFIHCIFNFFFACDILYLSRFFQIKCSFSKVPTLLTTIVYFELKV